MPFISDQALAQAQRVVHQAQEIKAKAAAHVARIREEKKEQIAAVVGVAEVVGAAAAIGFVRGKYEKNGDKFVVPGTSLDIQLLAGAALVGAGLAEVAGKYDDDIIRMGSGLLAGYAQDVFRNYGKTQTFAMVAGHGHRGMIGGPPVASMNDALRQAMAPAA